MNCETISAFDLPLPPPPQGVDLAGFVPTRAWCGDTTCKLFASFLVFRVAANLRIVLCTLDVLFLDDQFKQDLQVRVGEDTKFILVASHTHNAPNLAHSVQSLGRVNVDWYEEVLDSLASAIRGHAANIPVERIRNTVQPTDFCLNRRLPALSVNYSALKRGKISIRRGISMAPNPKGAVDGRLCLVEFADADGNMQACLWSLAAHAAFEPERRNLSSDYPGAVRSHLKAAYGSECVVLYLPGLAGSAIPAFKPKALHEMTAGEFLLSRLPLHYTIPPADPAGYEAFARDLATRLIDPPSESDWLSVAALKLEFKTASPEVIFHDRDRGALHLSTAALRMGNTLDLVVMNGEPLAEWITLLQSCASYAPSRIISGYGAGDCLYIPPDDELPKGGYEVSRFRNPFGLLGEFADGLNNKFRSAIAQVTQD